MKKLLIVFAAGALLASCSSTQDKEAAGAFCECYSMNDAGDATSVAEILESAQKMGECVTKFQEDYEGKISEDGFSAELKEQCPDAHAKAEEMGMFK
ncbi:MAG: hypothetical protein AB8B56_12430 [Crocinitomicaceae bacterium]